MSERASSVEFSDMEPLVEKVENELARYEHPLFRFSAEAAGSGVLLAIELREGLGVEHHYEVTLHEREIEDRQFPGRFSGCFTTACTTSSWRCSSATHRCARVGKGQSRVALLYALRFIS